MSWMSKEISESPEAVGRTIERNRDAVGRIAEAYRARGLTGISTVARGSSESAAIYFRYLAARRAGIPVSKFHPSLTTRYGAKPNMEANLLLAISQSGRSTDTLAAASAAKESGALTVAVTNDENSPLARAADFHLFLASGEENSVAATKSYLSETAVAAMLADALSSYPEKAPIAKIPPLLKTFFENSEAEIAELAKRNAGIENVAVLSRGLVAGAANELASKLTETSYLFSRPYSTADYLHGPIAAAGIGADAVLLAPSGVFEAEFTILADRLVSLGARLIAITDVAEIEKTATDCLKMPAAGEFEQPFLYAAAGLLFAEKLSEAKGLNPDVPRNLKKVTITK